MPMILVVSVLKPPAPTVEKMAPTGWIARSNVTVPARDDVGGDVMDAVGSVGHLIGSANDRAEHFVTDGPSFELAGTEPMTLGALMSNTIRSCVREGARVGAAAGFLLMTPLDFIVGLGSKKTSQYDPKSEGVLGMAVHAATELAGEVALVPGAVCGIVTGSIAAPFSRDPKAVLKSQAAICMETARAIVTFSLGLAAGLALTAVRAPSLLLKGLSAALGGFVGAVVGFTKSIAVMVRK
jgi:hypothetical protein